MSLSSSRSGFVSYIFRSGYFLRDAHLQINDRFGDGRIGGSGGTLVKFGVLLGAIEICIIK